jgi:hypothetical protein
MTVDGGVLLYGVGGPDPSRPTECTPLPLAGAAERIDQVAQSAVDEPPVIDIRIIESATDPALGYLCVVIPPSPRAPHMLVTDHDNRYWGRGATGNRVLTQAEIARLYERRERWELDRGALLDVAVANFPFSYDVEVTGAMVVVSQPVAPGRELLRVAAGTDHIDDFVQTSVPAVARHADVYPGQGTSALGQAHQLWRNGSDRWVLSRDRDPTSSYQAMLTLDATGGATYWHSPLINQVRDGTSYFMEQSATRAVYQLLATTKWLYSLARFYGPVDVCVAILGLTRAAGATRANGWNDAPVYGAAEYRRHERIAGEELRDRPEDVTRRLLAPLFEAISVRGYDPFAEAQTD